MPICIIWANQIMTNPRYTFEKCPNALKSEVAEILRNSGYENLITGDY